MNNKFFILKTILKAMKTLQEITNHYQNKEYSKRTFNKFYQKGEIREIELNLLDSKTIKYFETNSSLFISPKDYKKNNFSHFFYINTKEMETFIATQIKTYNNNEIEHLTYLLERNGNNIIARGEIRFNPLSPSLYFKNKPFIGWTSTEEEFGNRGFGKNRVYVFNALSHMIHGLTLHSNTLHCNINQTKIWETLERKNEAIRYIENGNNKWHFKGFFHLKFLAIFSYMLETHYYKLILNNMEKNLQLIFEH